MNRETVKLPKEGDPYLGRSDLRIGWCSGGPESPSHRAALCLVVHWSPSRGGWAACRCECHDVDLTDATFVAEAIAERLPHELYWRERALDMAAGKRPRRRPIAAVISAEPGDVELAEVEVRPAARVAVPDDEVAAYVAEALAGAGATRPTVAELLRAYRASGRSCSRERFRKVYDATVGAS